MKSVLVVDDEAGIRELLSRWLAAEKYEVRTATDAESALDMMSDRAASVVMCDVEMPGHGGLWLAERLRERFPDAAIVLATGVDSIPASTSFKSGIIEYLVKPFERNHVLVAVAKAAKWHDGAADRPAPQTNQEERLEDWIDSTDTDA